MLAVKLDRFVVAVDEISLNRRNNTDVRGVQTCTVTLLAFLQRDRT